MYKLITHIKLGFLPLIFLSLPFPVKRNEVDASKAEVDKLVGEISTDMKSGVIEELQALKSEPKMSKDEATEKLKKIGFQQATKQNDKIIRLAKLHTDPNIARNITIKIIKDGGVLTSFQNLIQDELETRSMGPFTLVTTETMKTVLSKALDTAKKS